MKNMVIATPILSDAAVLTASSSPPSLPVSNLQNRHIKQVWRSNDPLNTYVIIDFGRPVRFNLVALLGHTGSSRSHARVTASATTGFLGEGDFDEEDFDPEDFDTGTLSPFDSGELPFRSHQAGFDATWAASVPDEEYGALETNHFIYMPDTPQEYRYLRIDIADPVSSYIDIGRLYVADAWQAQTNMDYGLSEYVIDPSRVNVTAAGRVSSKENAKRRAAAFRLSFASEAEMRDAAFDLEWQRGVTKDILFIPDPEAGGYLQKRTIYGRLASLEPTVSAYFKLYEKNFRIEEITA